MIRGKYLNGAFDDLSDCFDIRREVFIKEQHVPESEEFDGLDRSCGHFIIYNEEDRPVATGRLIRVDGTHYQIGRVAALKNFRHKGYAEFLMLAMMEKVRSLGGTEISLLAQLTAVGFYEKCGFCVDGDEIIMDAGIKHRRMKYKVTQSHECRCCSNDERK